MTTRSKLLLLMGLVGLNSAVFNVRDVRATGYVGVCGTCSGSTEGNYTCCANCSDPKTCSCSRSTDCTD